MGTSGWSRVRRPRSPRSRGPRPGLDSDVAALAAGGRRVLALAEGGRETLRLASLVSFHDPPRPDSAALVHDLQQPGCAC